MADSGISYWPDTDALLKKLDGLVAIPPMQLRRDAMEGYLQYFETKCQKSKALQQEAKEYIPGSVQHNLSFNFPFPLCFDRAAGPYLWDVDGNQYIDFLCAGGPIILGHNYQPVREKVIELLKLSLMAWKSRNRHLYQTL